MIFKLVLKGLAKGKARFACAAAGIAIATGTLVFMTSLVATNNAQSERRAERYLSELPLEDGATCRMALDYRPGGHVMQGPPMGVVAAVSSVESGFDVSVTKALFSQRRLPVPPLGTELKLVGRKGTYTVSIVNIIDWNQPVRGLPNMFVSQECADYIAEEWQDFTVPSAADLAPMFKGDEQRRMDYATPLLLIAALLTALSLLVNSLLLSVESNRSTLATLRLVGLTRFGVIKFVLVESFLAGAVGWLLGVLGSMAALTAYVAADSAAFPAGVAFDPSRMKLTLAVLPLVVIIAVLFALAPALRVRGMDAAARLPRPRRRGMAITFALGFAAFVAVEVWGASLMRGFIPSPEWPDAIVSLLPGGVSSWDVEKLRDIEGVRRISELVPRQLELKEDGRVKSEEVKDGKPKGPMGKPNALFMAAEFLPKFNFVEGSWEESSAAINEGDAVVITLMLSNARNLHVGDTLSVMQPGRRGGPAQELKFPIVGVVDLNWHMVTSRGLVRGLNGSPGMTTGPVFCSFDTMGLIDPRTFMTEPAMSAPMTHLWVEYDPAFVAKIETETHDHNRAVFEAGRRIEAEITKRLGNPSSATVRLHARDEIADGTMAHGTDVIGQAARVPFIFLAILAIGFVAMLVAEADARKREFKILRAVGATKAQLALTLVKSAAKTALAGIVFGLPVGALAGWYTATGTAKMWAGMPHYLVIPWPVVLEGAFGALIFALLFAVPTAISLIRNPRD